MNQLPNQAYGNGLGPGGLDNHELDWEDISSDEDEDDQEPPPAGLYPHGKREFLWHRVKAFLRYPVGDAPTVKCDACHVSHLRICGIPIGEAPSEAAVVLPCGHMIGDRCITESTKAARCPVCQFSLRFRDQLCPHIIEGIYAPSAD